MDDTVMASARRLTEYLFFMIVSSVGGLKATWCKIHFPGSQFNACARKWFHPVQYRVMMCLLISRRPAPASRLE